MNKKMVAILLSILIAANTYITYGDILNNDTAALTEILEEISNYGEGRKEIALFYLNEKFESDNGIDEVKIDFPSMMSDKEKAALERRGISMDSLNSSLDALKSWDIDARLELLKYVENNQMNKAKELLLNDGEIVDTIPPPNGGGVPPTLGQPLPQEPQLPPTSLADKFIDIENHWAKNSIQRMADLGFVGGVSDNQFGPDLKVTRSQFAAFIIKILAIDTNPYGSMPFKDVHEASWYYDFVSTAYDLGLISGMSSDTFDPNSNVTREQLVVMIVNALKYHGYNSNIQDSDLMKYTDKDKLSEWALDSMKKAVALGIITGKSDTTIEPKGLATRAEAMVMLEKAYDLMNPSVQ